MVTIGIDGDGGDCVASLLIARHLGGARYVFHQGRNPRPFAGIANMLIPLFKTIPYVEDAYWSGSAPAGVTHDLCHWRPHFYKPTQTLAQSMANALNMGPLDYFPWISATPNPRGNGRVVISRTRRYNAPKFPWRHIISTFKNRLLFLGLDDERHQLERIAGFRIEHARVKNFLESAQLIAASDLLITNQTINYWLGAAMGHPLVQETEVVRNIHDSQVPHSNSVFLKDANFPFGNLPKKIKWEPVIDFQI